MTALCALVIAAWWLCRETFYAALTIADLIADRAAVTS